ncbi:MAG: DUF389 domain-containing protein [Nodosilinea sp.]
MKLNRHQFRQRAKTTWLYWGCFFRYVWVLAGLGAGVVVEPLQRIWLSQGPAIAGEALGRTRQELMEESQLAWPFLVLVVGSCMIATFGLLSNSAAVIIGAMLIAPLMLPIRGVAFGILEADRPLIGAGILALTVGTGLAIVISTGIGWLTGVAEYGSEVYARSHPTLLDLGIAVTAGALAGIAKVEPKLSSTVAGTAIAVALMPPVCTVGLWLAQGEFTASLGALLLYSTNLLGITLACMVAFVLAGYTPLRQARRPIGITLFFTTLLVLPLGASTLQLLRQNQLEASLRRALLDQTLTFQRLTLVEMNTDWLPDPPQVSLVVYAAEPVSPKQVQLLEEFVDETMGRPFKLNFFVSRVDAVTSDPPAEVPVDQGWQGLP